LTVTKRVKCHEDPDSAYAASVDAVPGGRLNYRIEIRNDSTMVKLPQICLTDVLSCDDWLIPASISASLNGTNVTNCLQPEFGASLLNGQRNCYTFGACRPASPWIAPGETLTIRFDVMVPASFGMTGTPVDCTNSVTVDGYSEACDPLPPPSDACDTSTSQAQFNVRIPRLECRKEACSDFDGNGVCDTAFATIVSVPGTVVYPFNLIYRLTVFNFGEAPLTDVKICDNMLRSDAMAAGLALGACQIEAADGCSAAGPLAPGASSAFTCRLTVPSHAAWLVFAGSDTDGDADCYRNTAQASGRLDAATLCDNGTNGTITSQGCMATVCVDEPPRGACCRIDGTCAQASPQECTSIGNTYLGDDTVCLGDGDGNGVDDACEQPIPTVSEWGLIVMTLLIVTVWKVHFGRRRDWTGEVCV